MKNIFFLGSIAMMLIVLFSCKTSEEEKRQKAVELMSTQTLGLAYLEEMKLEEAEREFTKFIELAPEDKLGYANLGLVYLRMGKYDESESLLVKAREIDPNDPEVNLLLGTVLRMKGESAKAIEVLEETVKTNPDHPKILFELCELYAPDPSEEAKGRRQEHLISLKENAPGNLVPLILLIDSYIKAGDAPAALEELEKLPAQFPEFPQESMPYFDEALGLLQAGDTEKALIPFTVFHNYQKVTYPYQSGMTQLKGPGESALGIPLINYSDQPAGAEVSEGAILEVIKFTEVAESAGIRFPGSDSADPAGSIPLVHHATGDFDGDGDVDIYLGTYDPSTGATRSHLFQNELGRYQDVTSSFGLEHEGNERSATFADFDNDGFLDLMITGEQGGVLYYNAGKGEFKNLTDDAGLENVSDGRQTLFADLDHDGDLDMFIPRAGKNRVLRNNGDMSFSELPESMGMAGTEEVVSKEALFGDFDDDGDLDLFVVNENAASAMYLNERQGRFSRAEIPGELAAESGSEGAAVGDYNNDGLLDIAIAATAEGTLRLFTNEGEGVLAWNKSAGSSIAGLSDLNIKDLEFVDFDNDGYLDLVVVGKPSSTAGRGINLLHNEGDGSFADLSRLLPEVSGSYGQVSTFDYNEDGDADLLLSGLNGGVSLLRNDGGNMNHYVSMKLVGLRTGSAKNNYFGIGSKVEMRAGDLYQSAVVTRPDITFGLGSRSKADVVRITWTNGVPQNIVLPDSDQSFVEEQTLKGSCPFLYTWDGEQYTFVKDITWRSALGMPLGIMGEDRAYAFPDASDDYILIPGDLLKPREGKYSLKITSELWETIYMDRVRLVAVDHPDSVEVFVPEQFSPPPFPGLELHQVTRRIHPVSAHNEKGLDVLDLISKKDDRYLSYFKKGKYQGLAEMHELILDPGMEADPKSLRLFLSGWIFPTDASINEALSQSDLHGLVPPSVEVINENGEWETAIPQLGFPMGKDKTVIADLSGLIKSADRRIRIRTNMEIYWDEIFFSSGQPVVDKEAPMVTTFMNPVSAELQYRGFSKMYRKGGQNGPHWFDYSQVSQEKKWIDLKGNYTGYGEVLDLLLASDDRYVISNSGDEMSLEFDQSDLPVLKKGWKRDFLIQSVGWVKDGDMNTAHGSTVEPLPYHGMSAYPPAPGDSYPQRNELKAYHERYNTRVVHNENDKEDLRPVGRGLNK